MSVNNLTSKNISQRLEEKKKLLQACLDNNTMGCDNYSPKQIHLISKTGKTLSLKYTYNGLNDKDEYYKYATFDTGTGKRITYDQMFTDPTNALALYEQKNLSNFKPEYIDPSDFE